MKKSDFGPSFHWGVSTAAAQIEGSPLADGRSPSIWDVFSARRGKIFQNHSPAYACDFYQRYAQDVDLMAYMGIDNYRFSLSWSRILPEGIGSPNHRGLDFYKRLIEALQEHDISPWITLYHWDLPQVLQARGGWVNREVLNWFEHYAEEVAKALMPMGVRNWMVLNEPMVFTGAGHFLGYHAPGLRGLSNFIPAMLHAALTTGVGERVLRSFRPDANIGSTYSCSWIEPASSSEADRLASLRADAALNRLFIEPAMGLGFPLQDLPMLSSVEKHMKAFDENLLQVNLDFIGVQNYTREIVQAAWYVPYLKARLVGAAKRNVPHTVMGWEVHPPALYHMLKKFSRYRPGLPLFVTENGAAFPDKPSASGQIFDYQRTAYLQQHIQQVWRAKSEGIPVTGYFVWTLLDNFEWAEGYKPRFGLVYVDFETQKRTIKQSGQWFSSFLQQQAEIEPAESEVVDDLPSKAGAT